MTSSTHQSHHELMTLRTAEDPAETLHDISRKAERVAIKIASGSPNMKEYENELIRYRNFVKDGRQRHIVVDENAKLEQQIASEYAMVKSLTQANCKVLGMDYIWPRLAFYCYNFVSLFVSRGGQQPFSRKYCRFFWENRERILGIMNDSTNPAALGVGTERNDLNDCVIFAIARYGSFAHLWKRMHEVQAIASVLNDSDPEKIVNQLRKHRPVGTRKTPCNFPESFDNILEVAYEYGTLLGFETDYNAEFSPHSAFTPVASSSRQPPVVLTSEQAQPIKKGRRCCF